MKRHVFSHAWTGLLAILFLALAACSEAPDQIQQLTVQPAQVQLEIGESELLIVAARFASGKSASVPVAWSSTDENVATVSDDGLVTALAAGKTSVTAAHSNGASVAIPVTVLEAIDKSEDPNDDVEPMPDEEPDAGEPTGSPPEKEPSDENRNDGDVNRDEPLPSDKEDKPGSGSDRGSDTNDDPIPPDTDGSVPGLGFPFLGINVLGEHVGYSVEAFEAGGLSGVGPQVNMFEVGERWTHLFLADNVFGDVPAEGVVLTFTRSVVEVAQFDPAVVDVFRSVGGDVYSLMTEGVAVLRASHSEVVVEVDSLAPGEMLVVAIAGVARSAGTAEVVYSAEYANNTAQREIPVTVDSTQVESP